MYLKPLEGLLYADSAEVRDAALVATLAWGSPLGASVLQRIVLDDPDASAKWLALYCALGGRREHARLLALLADPRRRARALFALGFSGNAALVEPLLPFLTSAHARERKLSAQSLSMITGLDILDARFALPEQEDVEDDADDFAADEDEELEAEDNLPEPNAATLREACRAWASRSATAGRLLEGEPFDFTRVSTTLARSALRRRHVHALALFIRSQSRFALDSRAFSHVVAKVCQVSHVAHCFEREYKGCRA